MGFEGLSPFRCEGMADLGALGMTDPGMDVVDPRGHRLHLRKLGRHQTFTHSAPVAEVSR